MDRRAPLWVSEAGSAGTDRPASCSAVSIASSIDAEIKKLEDEVQRLLSEVTT